MNNEDIEIEHHMNGYYVRFYPKKKLTKEESEEIKTIVLQLFSEKKKLKELYDKTRIEALPSSLSQTNQLRKAEHRGKMKILNELMYPQYNEFSQEKSTSEFLKEKK